MTSRAKVGNLKDQKMSQYIVITENCIRFREDQYMIVVMERGNNLTWKESTYMYMYVS